MKYVPPPLPVTSVRDIMHEVCQRYAELELSLSFADLLDHTTAKLHTVSVKTALNTSLMPPTFFENHIQETLPKRTRSQKAAAKRIAALSAELERAADYCALAQFPAVKPLRWLLDEALMHCKRFDQIRRSYQQEDQMRRQDRQKGGHKRHEDFRRLQRLVIRFLRTKAPHGGWMSKAHAADAIGQHLSDLATKYALGVSKRPDTLARNVLRLARTDSRAAAALQRHRNPRRSNRRRRR